MSKHARDNRPYIKPITRIELSGEHTTLRLIILIVLLIIGGVSIMIGLSSALEVEPGWQEAQVSSKKVNCSTEFTLMYDFSEYSSGESTDALKKVNALYTTLTEDAYAIFTASEYETDISNVRHLNDHVNEKTTVHPVLYNALELVAQYGSRYPFLAPVYEEYDRIFLQSSEEDAMRYDPSKSPELKEYIREAAAFANDSAMVWIELLGNNEVCLHVDEAYLAFADVYEIDTFFDFHWMTNAFIIDYMAEELAANGYTNGYIGSYNGFNRNLDTRGNAYSHNIYDNKNGEIYLPAVYNYDKPTSIVVLKNYPMSDKERWHYYSYSDGTVTTTYLDPADGMHKSATDNLFTYSRDHGCAEILLQTAPLFIAGELDVNGLQTLTETGIYAVWGEGFELHGNEADANITAVSENGGDQYSIILK